MGCATEMPPVSHAFKQARVGTGLHRNWHPPLRLSSNWGSVNKRQDICCNVNERSAHGALLSTVKHRMQAILEANSVFELRSSIMAAYADFGFHAAYFVAPVTRDRSEGRALTNVGFSMDFEAAFRDSGGAIDPLPDIALAAGGVVRVDRDGAIGGRAADGLQPTEAAYLSRFVEWGMADGVGAIAFGPGGRAGFTYVAGRIDEGAILAADVAGIRTVAVMSYQRYCQLIDRETEASAQLSPRELEILHWMARGKSNSVIAEILGISAATVGTYMRRIFSKLGRNDRTSAVLAGVEKGYVSPSPNAPPSAMRRAGGG
ncbi:MAG: hypothetical protein GC152_13035 [Alphaproteobacteria bacterium]|nr:hypothetical protein [Alphaproteobacteria bacterium]